MHNYRLVLWLAVLSLGLLSACTAPAGDAKYNAGTYTASAEGYGGPVTVDVTVDEAAITQVTISGPNETTEIGGEAIKTLPEAIKKANSDQVDSISGATVTSNAVKKATADCLKQAKK